MAQRPRIVITGDGALCAAGHKTHDIWQSICSGKTSLAAVEGWDASDWPCTCAGEIRGMKPRDLVPNRKIHKYIRRTDLFGLNAAGQAMDQCGLIEWREAQDESAKLAISDAIGTFVGSGGGSYESQYDFFPLFEEAAGDLHRFGSELTSQVNPMWLLRTLPNNVLCHVGIRYDLKGTNACITNHAISGILAIVEATEALRHGEADRAVVIGHDAPVEPQMVLYYHQLGLVARQHLKPFDTARDGSVLGEGAAALILETEAAAAQRGARVIGEVLGSGAATDALGLLTIREDGARLERAIRLALDDAGLRPDDVGMIVAHANGTRHSDASEATAINAVFGDDSPPVTGFKWAFGHLIAASGIIESVLALQALRKGLVPAMAALTDVDPTLPQIQLAQQPTAPRSDVALVLSRGFSGSNVALLLRASPE